MRSGLGTTVARYFVSFLILLVFWTLITVLFSVPTFLLPPPSTVAQTLWSEWPFFADAARYTLLNALTGAMAGIALGMLTGLLAAYSRMLRWVLEPYLVVFQSFPRESLFPLLIVWLGFGATTKMVNAGLLSFFPIAIMTLNSLLDTRQEYVALIRGWGASRIEEFLYCRLPAFVPTLFSAIKVALPLALIGAVLGEFMGGNRGLGYIIVSSGAAFRTDRLFAAVSILAITGTIGLAAIQFVQTRFFERFNQE